METIKISLSRQAKFIEATINIFRESGDVILGECHLPEEELASLRDILLKDRWSRVYEEDNFKGAILHYAGKLIKDGSYMDKYEIFEWLRVQEKNHGKIK